MIDQEFQQLIKTNIITELGLEVLSNEKKVALINKLAELTEKRVLVKILDNLTEKDIEEYEKISDSDDENKQIVYLKKMVPNFIEILQEEVVKVKKELLDEMLVDENII